MSSASPNSSRFPNGGSSRAVHGAENGSAVGVARWERSDRCPMSRGGRDLNSDGAGEGIAQESLPQCVFCKTSATLCNAQASTKPVSYGAHSQRSRGPGGKTVPRSRKNFSAFGRAAVLQPRLTRTIHEAPAKRMGSPALLGYDTTEGGRTFRSPTAGGRGITLCWTESRSRQSAKESGHYRSPSPATGRAQRGVHGTLRSRDRPPRPRPRAVAAPRRLSRRSLRCS
jgi:hypothetical protein